MRNYLFLILISLLIAFPNCKSQTAKQDSAEFFFDSFILGWGGGFSGLYDEYKISGVGNVSKKNFETGIFEYKGSFPSKESQLIFKELDVLSPRTILINDPGNMTMYLEVFKGEQSHKITWGGNQSTPPEDLQQFFNRMKERIGAL